MKMIKNWLLIILKFSDIIQHNIVFVLKLTYKLKKHFQNIFEL